MNSTARKDSKYHSPFQRIFVIVADSFGIGALTDGSPFQDPGADTWGHIDAACGPLHLPALMHLGLGELHKPVRTPAVAHPAGTACRLLETSQGKDTITGHWEMMGLVVKEPFVVFTDTGFPPELIRELEEKTGHTVIGNKAASGTEILKELAKEELDSDSEKIIVYTSADSVLQICGCEQTMGLPELYRICETAREITMKPEWKVARVIARPYVVKEDGSYERTPNRRDYAIAPPSKTVLNVLQDHGLDVISVGKISDIFHGEGISRALHSESSDHGMKQAMELAAEKFHGLAFINLVDFDAKWGHRRNPEGYARELETFDANLTSFMQQMRPDDLLMVCADHGNDPTYAGTDHTREMVPLLMWAPGMEKGVHLPDQKGFGCIGATILDNFALPVPGTLSGHSLLPEILSACAKKNERPETDSDQQEGDLS